MELLDVSTEKVVLPRLHITERGRSRFFYQLFLVANLHHTPTKERFFTCASLTLVSVPLR